MIIDHGTSQIRVPDFLLIGASRSGTTSMYHYLRAHPKIFLPENKEPHFFNSIENWKLEAYLALFKQAGRNQIMGEATSTYLYYWAESIKNIGKLYQDQASTLKIMAILRNPIERSWSYYMLMRRRGERRPFMELARYLQDEQQEHGYDDFMASGMYSRQIESYLNHFQNVHIMLFDELVHEPKSVIKQAYQFLDLQDIEYLPQDMGRAYNSSGLPRNRALTPLFDLLFKRHGLKTLLKPIIPYDIRQRVKSYLSAHLMKKPDIPPSVRKYLFDIFEDDMQRLANLLNEEKKKKVINEWLG